MNTRRAVIYARVSTSDQKLDSQLDEAKAYIHRRGWLLTETYEDVGWSGAKERRPGLDKMLGAARKRHFDTLVVFRSDRLFRSVHHMTATLAEFHALGIDFVSCMEAFDTSTPNGRLLFNLCTSFAQFEREIIAERTRAGMAAARSRGTKVGRRRVRVDIEGAMGLMKQGLSVRAVAQSMRVGYGTLQRALVAHADESGATKAGPNRFSKVTGASDA